MDHAQAPLPPSCWRCWPAPATGSGILELAKNAYNLFLRQSAAEQARLLRTLISNCTIDRGSLSPTYTSPFDLFVKGNETGDWLALRDAFRNWLVSAA